ncbi:unnamed protein product [Anisakis simplex]|uniref:Fumarate hydratase n=1 Tax=Anisakis simplex TaxID=6269 RepID=A0A0M3J4R1_ANISI|nr:unnamed protein product [Anisakis simplex]
MLSRVCVVRGNAAALLQNSLRMASAKIRKERDTFGELEVPADRYYGAQTARFYMQYTLESDLIILLMLFGADGKVQDELQNWRP